MRRWGIPVALTVCAVALAPVVIWQMTKHSWLADVHAVLDGLVAIAVVVTVAYVLATRSRDE